RSIKPRSLAPAPWASTSPSSPMPMQVSLSSRTGLDATRNRGDRPLQPDHAQQLPEMPAALLVQPPPRVGRGAALGGHGARRLSARGAAGLPRAGGGMAPARSGTAAAVA